MLKYVLTTLAVLFATSQAQALEIWRNQTRYDIPVSTPKGTSFQASGVDRRLNARGIEVNLRLIQDDYSTCSGLTRERAANWAKNGYAPAGKGANSRRECSITLVNAAQRKSVTSHYVLVDACKCYAAVHFTYASSASGQLAGVSGPILSSLRRGGGGAAPQAEARSVRADNPAGSASGGKASARIGATWTETFNIYKRRGFPPSIALRFYIDHEGGASKDELARQALAEIYGVSASTISESKASAGDWAYDVETGRLMVRMSPQQFARNISRCYAQKEYWRSCKLNYHMEMGCRMTPKWKTVCRGYKPSGNQGAYIGDLCFWEPRGDLPILAAGAKSEPTVQLPNQNQQVAKAEPQSKPRSQSRPKAKAKPAPKKQATPARAMCPEEPWPEIFGKM